MAVDVNYWWIALMVIGTVMLVVWQIKRDHKDKKKVEDIIKSSFKAKKHDE